MTRTVLACSLLFAFASAASADPVEVSIDQSKILTLNQPAKEIILGNPSIVDASILHENLLVLTGKTPGVT